MAAMTKEEFTQLVFQYERTVYTVCYQLVRNAAAAEDLTQDTFLSAYLHRERCPAGYERQWLGRIAANKAKDHLQSAWNRHALLPGDEAIPPAWPRQRRSWRSGAAAKRKYAPRWRN